MWVRALQVLSVLLGIVAVVRERLLTMVAPVANVLPHRPRSDSGGRHTWAAGAAR